MARANTYEWDKIDGYFSKRECVICGNPSEYRAFYYPTYMNGDAEWLGDYCKGCKGTDLKKVYANKIPLRYKIGD